MIAEIGLSAESLVELSHAPGFSSTTLWEALLGSLWSHGSVLLTSSEEMAKIERLLHTGDLSVEQKQQLSTILTTLQKDGRLDIRPGAMTDAEDIQTLHQALPLVAVLPEGSFQTTFPTNQSGTEALDSQINASVAAAVRQSPLLTGFRRIAQAQNFPTGTPRESIWTQLFLPLAQEFPRVSICDRYLLGEMIYRDARGVSAEWSTPEHLGWLLTNLDQVSPPNTRVALYTQIVDPSKDPDGPHDADDIVDLIDRQWTVRSGGRIEAIEIYAVQWHSRTHPHNRHLRFGHSLGFKLDEGLDRLADKTVTFDAGFSYSYVWRPSQMAKLRADEELIRQTANLSTTEWKPQDGSS